MSMMNGAATDQETHNLSVVKEEVITVHPNMKQVYPFSWTDLGIIPSTCFLACCDDKYS